MFANPENNLIKKQNALPLPAAQPPNPNPPNEDIAAIAAAMHPDEQIAFCEAVRQKILNDFNSKTTTPSATDFDIKIAIYIKTNSLNPAPTPTPEKPKKEPKASAPKKPKALKKPKNTLTEEASAPLIDAPK